MVHDAGCTLCVSRTRRGDHETFLFWDEDSGVMDLVDQRVDMGVFRFPRTRGWSAVRAHGACLSPLLWSTAATG